MKEYLDSHQFQWIASVILVVSWFVLRLILKRVIDRISLSFDVIPERKKTIVRILNFILFFALVITVSAVWGIESKQLLLFVTSTVTFLGIAFFAQWSIISNVTSGIILFFHHPIRMGDHVKIVDKDFFVEGKIDSISFFFMHLISDEGEKITVPNNIALQKTISVISREQQENN
jgi:small-conductance mechanosensitive channel